MHWLDALSPPLDAHIGRLTHTIKALLTTPSADEDAAETVEANKAQRRVAAMPIPPPAAAQRTNWLMWTAIFVGLTGVILIAILWIIMSARNQHEVVANPPAFDIPGLSGIAGAVEHAAHPPAVPHPPAAPGAMQKWSGVNNRNGALFPDAFEMELKIAKDGTISGTSTEVQITTGGIPVRAAVVKGRVTGSDVTFTKSFSDDDIIEYKGTINAERSEMSGTWRHGNDKGTFTANLGSGEGSGDLPDLP